jgi:glycosyltransferase involved in cell wall biosynthesis
MRQGAKCRSARSLWLGAAKESRVPFHLSIPSALPRSPVSGPLVIIPALNEARAIAEVVLGVRASCRSDILVINDGSRDATAERAAEAGATVLSHPFNLGYGAALQTGYKYAVAHGYDTVVQMDADGQHDPAYIPALLVPLAVDEADLVIGSRFKEVSGYEMSLTRSAGRVFFQRVLVFFGGPKIQDPTSGLQALSRPVFELCCSDFFPFDFPDIDVLLLLHRHGFRILEIPVKMAPSPEGRRPMHTGLTALYYPYKMLLSTFRSWRARPTEGKTT